MVTPPCPGLPAPVLGNSLGNRCFPIPTPIFTHLPHFSTTWGSFLSSYCSFPGSKAWPHLAPAPWHGIGEKFILSSRINPLSHCSSDLFFHLKLFYYQSFYTFVSATTKAQHGTLQEKVKPTNLCKWDVLWETKDVLKEKYLRKSLCQNPFQDHSHPRTL